MTNLLLFPEPGLSDASARAAALDVERSFIVEAPAGSGKTGLLLQRYLRLLADEAVIAPEQVLAITFTKAATEEIRDRVLQALETAQTPGEPRDEYAQATRTMARAVLERDRLFSWNLLAEPQRLRVRTIDAVCAEIARSLPLSNSGNAVLTPIEDASALYSEAARRTWLRLGSDNQPLSEALRTLLLHRDGDIQACEALLGTMLAEREQWGTLIPLASEEISDEVLDSHVREQLNETLEQVVCDALTRLRNAFPAGILERLTNLARALSERSGSKGLVSPLAVCRELRAMPDIAAAHLQQWRALAHLLVTPSTGAWRRAFNSHILSFEVDAKDRLALQEMLQEVQDDSHLLERFTEIRNLPPAVFPEEQWPVTKALFHILRQALIELQLVFSERGVSDFAEVSLLAQYALKQAGSAENLESATGLELRHLLVDEMQDTSVRQYELIQRLTFGWEHERKTVFLVGDPKQSIYLFRQARVERFVETVRTKKLGDLPLEVLQLTANFRSQAGLIKTFNADFGAIFPREITHSDEVSYQPAVATRAPATGLHDAAWHLVSVAAGDTVTLKKAAASRRKRNARTIRKLIEAWRNKPLPRGRTSPWKIAVIVRSRQSLANVLPELRRESPVPVRALKIDSLRDRQEILDLLALTRALLHPADRTAWLAILRAPWCGLELADLHRLTGLDDDTLLQQPIWQLIVDRGAELSDDGVARLQRTWPALHTALTRRRDLRVPERVERTWRALGGHTYLHPAELQNTASFFDLLRSIDAEAGRVLLPDLLRRLTHLYAAPENLDDGVELVTMHGAKGLEWDVVLVPELERSAPVAKSRLLEWEQLAMGGVVLAPISGKGEDSEDLNLWLRGLRTKREAAEAKRLFYVACTRAREELHLFGVVEERANGRLSAPHGSLLRAAWAAAEAHVVAGVSPGEPGNESGLDLQLAAGAAESLANMNPVLLQRLPLQPATESSAFAGSLMSHDHSSPVQRRYQPSGNLASRALGTTVHAFLEETSAQLASGVSPADLAHAIQHWSPRIRNFLRMFGLPPQSLDAQVNVVLQALHQTISTPVGLWILGSRAAAHSEFALSVWAEEQQHYRMDRVFRAGESPGAVGDQDLWIIDYKSVSAPPGSDAEAVDTLIALERSRYESQLESYARIFRRDNVRVGLWFPLLARFEWWVINSEGQAPSQSTFRETNRTGAFS